MGSLHRLVERVVGNIVDMVSIDMCEEERRGGRLKGRLEEEEVDIQVDIVDDGEY